jgi:hypothetical protein
MPTIILGSYMKKYGFIFLIGLVYGCATPSYQFHSSPAEAEVELVFKGGTKKILGKTPLTVEAAEINPTKEAMIVNFRKVGAESQSVFVPPSMFVKSVEIGVNLPEDPRVAQAQKGEKIISEIASQVADTQMLIQAKQYGIAEQKLIKMIAEHPNVSVFYSLLGNIQYLDRKLDAALGYYKKAQDLNPTSVEIEKVIQKIENIKGGVVK